MEISALFIGLALALFLFDVSTVVSVVGSAGTTDGASLQVSSLKCTLQGTTHLPAFSMNGDYIIGGLFSIHANMYMAENNYTTAPEPPRCTGRLVSEKC